jgi:hypothetical protein
MADAWVENPPYVLRVGGWSDFGSVSANPWTPFLPGKKRV